MELYAGTAKATLFSKQYGLNAVEPFDKNEGKDLTQPAQRRLVERALQQLRPLLLLVGFPCTLWNLLNENRNYYQLFSSHGRAGSHARTTTPLAALDMSADQETI